MMPTPCSECGGTEWTRIEKDEYGHNDIYSSTIPHAALDTPAGFDAHVEVSAVYRALMS